MPTKDDGFAVDGQGLAMSDAHGQAALVLVESLIHALIERSVLSVDDSLDILRTAIEVQTDVADAADGAGARMWQSVALLAGIAASLQSDAPPPADGDGVSQPI